MNRLVLETEEEKKDFEDGERHKVEKKKSSTESLKKIPPTQEELRMIHNIFIQSKNGESANKVVPISHTKRQTLIICHPQETNIHNTIFGGYLLRLVKK